MLTQQSCYSAVPSAYRLPTSRGSAIHASSKRQLQHGLPLSVLGLSVPAGKSVKTMEIFASFRPGNCWKVVLIQEIPVIGGIGSQGLGSQGLGSQVLGPSYRVAFLHIVSAVSTTGYIYPNIQDIHNPIYISGYITSGVLFGIS